MPDRLLRLLLFVVAAGTKHSGECFVVPFRLPQLAALVTDKCFSFWIRINITEILDKTLGELRRIALMVDVDRIPPVETPAFFSRMKQVEVNSINLMVQAQLHCFEKLGNVNVSGGIRVFHTSNKVKLGGTLAR